MTVRKTFECQECDAHGTITIKNEELNFSDITTCPVCGADIRTPEPEEPEEE